jgi:hypothetical protein
MAKKEELKKEISKNLNEALNLLVEAGDMMMATEDYPDDVWQKVFSCADSICELTNKY